ncbi:MAG: hypothetical protein A2010_03265 [Nitrospirae bacterium GWD2_57_9]|nr:MAG: hypothetical protein A2010_03265 [Nitrospirae bacterium GWD2_57_9]
MFTDNRKVILYTLVGGISLWVIDGIVDSLFFSHQTIADSLVLNVGSHELYFRTLFLVSFIIFGFVISRALARRKNAQHALEQALAKVEEEKARSQAIVSAIGDGISIQGLNLKVTYQNQVHKNLVGGEKTGQYCYMAYSERDSACPGCPVALTLQDGGIHTLEKQLVKSAENRMIEIKSSPLRDATGRIIAVIEAVRDITDRKQVLEKLTLFSKAIEEAMDGIQIIDMSGRVMYSNKAVEKIYGFTPEELQGSDVNQMNVDKEFAVRNIIPEIKLAGRWSGEVTVHHKKGHTFPIWLSTALVADNSGSPIAMIGIIRDMTERKQAENILNNHRQQLVKLVEEQTGELSRANEMLRKEMAEREIMEAELLKAQKLESLGILAGGIAHDFNNLLSSLLGNVSLAMLDLERDHPAYQQLAGAEKACLRAQDLTRQLLTFSKGGAPVKKTTDLGELIREASGFALRGSRVRCEIAVSEGLHLADVDEGQISQVVHNLVINADHAMPEGGTIDIRCSNVHIGKRSVIPLKEGDYILIGVEDRGVGIPKEHLAKIFDPYFTTKQKGSGLGLATTYSIIKKHGGHIAVESTLGSGTIFNVYLPASNGKIILPKHEEPDMRNGEGMILIMDDEDEVRETTGKVLMRIGYNVDYAADGMEAIDKYRKAKETGRCYDLVIMDLTVPGGMGGKEAMQKLREVDPGVKAIVSSGYSNDPIMANYKTYGFSGVVTKPYRLKDLSEEVRKIIHGNAKQ